MKKPRIKDITLKVLNFIYKLFNLIPKILYLIALIIIVLTISIYIMYNSYNSFLVNFQGLIGSALGVFGVLILILYYYFDTKKIINSNKEITEKNIKSQRLNQYLPYLISLESDYTESSGQPSFYTNINNEKGLSWAHCENESFFLKVKNIGLGPAVNVKIYSLHEEKLLDAYIDANYNPTKQIRHIEWDPLIEPNSFKNIYFDIFYQHEYKFKDTENYLYVIIYQDIFKNNYIGFIDFMISEKEIQISLNNPNNNFMMERVDKYKEKMKNMKIKLNIFDFKNY